MPYYTNRNQLHSTIEDDWLGLFRHGDSLVLSNAAIVTTQNKHPDSWTDISTNLGGDFNEMLQGWGGVRFSSGPPAAAFCASQSPVAVIPGCHFP